MASPGRPGPSPSELAPTWYPAHELDTSEAGEDPDEKLGLLATAQEPPSRKNLGFILSLSAGFLGLQGVFTVFFGSGNFYLRSLGLGDAAISACWLAGPATGLLFQPYVGALSDGSSCGWGKRRPFILGGALVVAVSVVATAWAREIVGRLSGISPPAGRDASETHGDLVIFVNLCIWTTNLAIQPVQMGLRSLLIDLLPAEQQSRGNAWAARMTMAGNVAGYLVSSADLTRRFWFLGGSQFQVLSALVSANLLVCVSAVCYSAEERPDPGLPRDAPSLRRCIAATARCMGRISGVTARVCLAQFFSWLAWFPFLYYTARYASNLYRTERPDQRPTDDELTRSGSFAMLIFALSSLVGSIILPWMARPEPGRNRASAEPRVRSLLSLRRIWIACCLVFAACMASTFLVTSYAAACAVVAAMGLAWVGGSWIPITLISRDIRRPPSRDTGDGDPGEFAATTVGIHNMAICAPQILSSLAAGLFFLAAGRGAQPSGGLEVWLLRAGGVFAFVAAGVVMTLPDD